MAITSVSGMGPDRRTPSFVSVVPPRISRRAGPADVVETIDLAGEVTAKGFVAAFASRMAQVLEQMAAGAVARRVLELTGARFTREATEGLERFLVAAEAGDPARALAITNVFAKHPEATVYFLGGWCQTTLGEENTDHIQ